MKVITTVGTSLISNYRKKQEIQDIIEDLKLVRYTTQDLDNKEDADRVREHLMMWVKNNDFIDSGLSAEIKSILKLKEIYGDITVHLLATDTVLCVIAAEVIKKFLESVDIDVRFDKNEDVIKGLQVEDKNVFIKIGLNKFVQRLNEITNHSDGTDQNNNILNITGGYKALIPYMTIIAQIMKTKISYIFEDTDELIEIPYAPMDFDYLLIHENYLALKALYKLFKGKEESSQIKEKSSQNNKKDVISIEEFEKEYGYNTSRMGSKKDNLVEKLKNNNIVEIDELNNIKLSYLGYVAFTKYEELFQKERFHVGNLIGNLIELKLFKYFIKTSKEEATIKHGEKIDGYEIDVLIENEKVLRIIEVKPGDNVPIRKLKDKNKSLEYKFTEGSFKHLIEKISEKKLKFEIYLYSRKPIHSSVCNELSKLYNELIDKDPKIKEDTIKFFWLKIPDNYFTNVKWNVKKGDISELEIKIEGSEGNV